MMRSMVARLAILIMLPAAGDVFDPQAAIAQSSPATTRSLSFSAQVQPILARHCYKCHGPDASTRQAELRLDRRADATAVLPSGKVAVVPQRAEQSELLARVRADDDDRMPPEGPTLTDQEIAVLEAWIESGAAWDVHWAFRPLQDPHAEVSNRSLDAFAAGEAEGRIDSLLLADGYRMRAPASRAKLLRRVYLDLLGLPPTPEQLAAFLVDDRPDAYTRLVDRLLASPHYGERWGRHWLDVARYGDSNGGDENHAYPLAHRYRDYVIRALNLDTPYDIFVQEQLAGDLMPALPDDPNAEARRIAATGYLAIGMKILAEKDPQKKQADLVDEQINTVGRTFLGLSLGCARCHDHKFDPITSRDYYALAGVFHSTAIMDRSLQNAELAKQQQSHEASLAALRSEIAVMEAKIGEGALLEREAESFDRGNAIIDRDSYGKGIGIISDPGSQKNFAEYDIVIPKDGDYALELRYAAKNARPGRILVDGKVAVDKAIAKTTGGWYPDSQRWSLEGTLTLAEGRHVLRIESEPLMSHIDRWRFYPAGAARDARDKLETLRTRLEQARKAAPQPARAMAVQEGSVKNVRLHRRGSHLDLGAEVPRGVIASLDPQGVVVSEERSGRLALARWLTSPDSAITPLTARVIVNRLWHWHFGQGLVVSTDDFGARGEAPRHPRLLDSLASQLMRDGWSLKSLHRRIVLSRAYRQSREPGIDASSSLLARKRLEPEVMRDAMLLASGSLDRSMFNSPMRVKSQDPSPEDARKNQEFYETFPRRSVYLPVVRTHVYDYLTLFDFPNVATPIGRRDETAPPTQALWMWNSRFMDDMSTALAVRLLAKHQTENAALDEAFVRIISRSPSPEEQKAFLNALERFRQMARGSAADREQEALSALIQTLFLSSEAMEAP